MFTNQPIGSAKISVKKLLTEYKGSAYECQQHDLVDNENNRKETPSLSVYQKIKYEDSHKDVPTSDWIRNILFLGN